MFVPRRELFCDGQVNCGGDEKDEQIEWVVPPIVLLLILESILINLSSSITTSNRRLPQCCNNSFIETYFLQVLPHPPWSRHVHDHPHHHPHRRLQHRWYVVYSKLFIWITLLWILIYTVVSDALLQNTYKKVEQKNAHAIFFKSWGFKDVKYDQVNWAKLKYSGYE